MRTPSRAIIEESVFIIVQNIRKSRRRPTKMGDMGMFSGLLYCAECGGKMYQCRATNFAEEPEILYLLHLPQGEGPLHNTFYQRMWCCMKSCCENLREAITVCCSQHEAEFMQEAAESRYAGSVTRSLRGSAIRWQRRIRALQSLTVSFPDCMRTM